MEELAGILLALIAVGLILSLATHGMAGGSAWFRAKFLGKETVGVSR